MSRNCGLCLPQENEKILKPLTHTAYFFFFFLALLRSFFIYLLFFFLINITIIPLLCRQFFIVVYTHRRDTHDSAGSDAHAGLGRGVAS